MNKNQKKKKKKKEMDHSKKMLLVPAIDGIAASGLPNTTTSGTISTTPALKNNYNNDIINLPC